MISLVVLGTNTTDHYVTSIVLGIGGFKRGCLD